MLLCASRIGCVSLLLLSLSGCTSSAPVAVADAATNDAGTSPASIESDITPKTGKGTPPSGATANGPWSTRLMIATSMDGRQFTRANEVVSDQAGVPSAFVDREGRLRLAYIDWGNGNIMATAVKNVDGKWAFRRITFEPPLDQPKPDPVDPTIVKLSNGDYRLFFMHSGKFRSAVSRDGFVFALDAGERFAYSAMLYDPAVLETNNGWLLWANLGDDKGFAYGKASDGLNFVAEAARFSVGGKPFDVWSAAKVEGGYRISGGARGVDGIASAFSTDAVSWMLEGSVLTQAGSNPALEGPPSPDHGYTRVADGTYVVAYLAPIP